AQQPMPLGTFIQHQFSETVGPRIVVKADFSASRPLPFYLNEIPLFLSCAQLKLSRIIRDALPLQLPRLCFERLSVPQAAPVDRNLLQVHFLISNCST